MTSKKKLSTAVSTKRGMKPGAEQFWDFVSQQAQMTEAQRLKNIKQGLSTTLPESMGAAFGMELSEIAASLQTSVSSLKQQVDNLNLGTSERIDRIAEVAGQAGDVLESRHEVIKWLTSSHAALGNEIPIELCDTEIGARQVRRVLSAIEWGNVA